MTQRLRISKNKYNTEKKWDTHTCILLAIRDVYFQEGAFQRGAASWNVRRWDIAHHPRRKSFQQILWSL